MVDGTKPIAPPIVPENVELVRFNPLFAHLFAALSKSQSMSALEIVPSEQCTISRLMESSFPAIKATDNVRTPLVSKHTVGYIHALMIDTVTLLACDPPRARALRNERMIVEVLDECTDVFRTELRDCLVDYYEQILKMDGAGGIPRSTPFKRKFKSVSAASAASAAGDGGGGVAGVGGGGNEVIDDSNTVTSPPAAGAEAAEPAPAAATAEKPHKAVRARGGKAKE